MTHRPLPVKSLATISVNNLPHVLDVYTSAANYVDHIAPIWNALPDQLRGTWWTKATGHRRAVELDLPARRTHQPPPADHPILVASYADEKVIRQRPVIYLEHGVGQHYNELDASSFGRGNRRNVVLYLATNDYCAERMQRQFPNADTAIVGAPKLDQHIPIVAERLAAATHDTPTVGFGWHWNGHVPESKTARPRYARAIAALDMAIVGHGHPRIFDQLTPWYQKLGIPTERHFDDLLDRIDVYACDNSSTMFEAAALDMPVVVLNAPWYRRNVEHGIRFWSHSGIGPHVDHPHQLPDAIAHAWTERDWYQPWREDVRRDLYPHLGAATLVAVDAIRRCII